MERAPPTVDSCARIARKCDRLRVQIGGRTYNSRLDRMREQPSHGKYTEGRDADQTRADCDESFHPPFYCAICREAVHAHLLEQPMHVGKKCRGASFSKPGE